MLCMSYIRVLSNKCCILEIIDDINKKKVAVRVSKKMNNKTKSFRIVEVKRKRKFEETIKVFVLFEEASWSTKALKLLKYKILTPV